MRRSTPEAYLKQRFQRPRHIPKTACGISQRVWRKSRLTHANERADLEARVEAAEERERAFVVARAAERERVWQALERARVQLLELKDLRDQA